MSVVRDETRLVTVEDLSELPEKPGVRYELVDGEVIEIPGASAVHGLIVELLLRLIGAHVRDRDLGVALGDGTGYILSRTPDRLRLPDMSFVSCERVPGGEVPDEGYWQLAPDLAVEVVSPGDRAEDIHDMVQEYLEAGTIMVLVLWPRRRSATMYVPGATAREFGAEDQLDGGDVLPGFQVKVNDLFEVHTSRGSDARSRT